MKRKYKSILFMVLFIMSTLTACGASTGSQMSSADIGEPSRTPAMNETAAAPPMGGSTEAIIEDPAEIAADTEGGKLSMPENMANALPTDRKIVFSMDISLETMSFDEAAKQIPEIVQTLGGFIENSYIEGTNLNQKYSARTARFTVRVPADKLDAFPQALSEKDFQVVYEQKNSSDISDTYYDSEARLDSLRIQEERLIAMLEGAQELKYMLELERELADVRYQIESITASLRRMENQVSLSTVTVSLQEVSSYGEDMPSTKPATFKERANEMLGNSWDSFQAFCEILLLFVIALLPFLPLAAVIVGVIWFVRRAGKKRRLTRQSLPTAVDPNHAYPPVPTAQPPMQKPEDKDPQ